MSKAERALARAGVDRGKHIRAGCDDPHCWRCGEPNIRRLILPRRKAAGPPRRIICCNCYKDRTHDPAEISGMFERFAKAGYPNPKCTLCGDAHIWRLELDHIAGKDHDDATAPLCANCHAERTFFQQAGKPQGGEAPKNVFEVIGRWLRGIAEWLELIIDKLYQYGDFLIDLAKRGYGGDLRFT